MSAIIEFSQVTKSFQSKGAPIIALDGIDLSIEAGEIFGIIGYSGAGKSTLVRLINGLETATSGRIVVDGVEITALKERDLPPVRSRIGMIFQQFNLLRSRTIAGNVEFPLKVAGWPKAKRRERVAELLDFVGLLSRAYDHPEQLSGGQKQRVGIARALAVSPSVLLADEATSALDPETTQDVLELLKRTNREFGVTIVVITHEMDVIRSIADRVAVLDHGRLVETGSTFDVFAEPKADATKKFLKTVIRNRPDADTLAQLQREHPGRLVTAQVRDVAAFGDALEAANERGARGRIVFGGFERLQGQELGSVTLSFSGEDAAVQDAIERLGSAARLEEVHA